MLEIRTIQPGDMDYVKKNPFQESLKTYPDYELSEDDTVTCIFDGEIVAVGGVVEYEPGIGGVWLALTEPAKKKGVFGLIAFNAIENKMNELIKNHKFERTIAHARTDFPKAQAFIKAMGFKEVDLLEEVTPDKCDLIVYSRDEI